MTGLSNGMMTLTTLGHVGVARGRERDDVLIAGERHRLAVDLDDLEVELVDVEHVRFLRRVLDGPLLDVAERYDGVDAVRVVRLAVDGELVRVRGVGEDDRARCA